MPTFDGETLTITLDAVVAGVLDVDVGVDLYTEWKTWMRSGNMRYPEAFRTTGGDPLTAIINAGSYFFLRNDLGWRIKPFENTGTYYLVGNLAVEDTTLPAFVPTAGAFTAAILGLQPVTQGVTPVMADQLAFASFDGRVTIDVTNGTAGTGNDVSGDPIGTVKSPSSNLADALIIANARGFSEFSVIGDLTIGGALDLEDFIFIGQGRSLTTLTIDTAPNVLNCTFSHATVTGVLDGGSLITDGDIAALDVVSGVAERCVLEASTITLGGSQVASFLDCYSGVPGTGTAVIDCGGSGQALAMRGYNGGVKLENKTGPEAVSIDLAAGQVIIDTTTVTNGTIVVRGDGKVIDQAGDILLSGTYGSMVLVNETISGVMVREIWQMLNLDPDTPVVIDSNTISFGGITIDITGTTTKTFTRQP